MRAIILSAGRGQRMRPLSEHTPKPLLTVAGLPLIVYHLQKFAKVGIHEIIINLGHLGEKLVSALGDGSRFGLHIEYSYEDPILETGGGIVKVLSKLGPEPFVAISGDVFTDFPFERLKIIPRGLAHLVLVDNPPHHRRGDYALVDNQFVAANGGPLLNFAGIGVYRPELFLDSPSAAFRLPDLFKPAFINRQITGEHYDGLWYNIGTPEQLDEVDKIIRLMQANNPLGNHAENDYENTLNENTFKTATPLTKETR
jgi:MurNAc alpha-1-phosphate uridylyltransferase